LTANLDVPPDENTERVRFLVWYEFCLTARMIAEELNINREVVWLIYMENWG
jgi:hypothetical protein